MKRTLLAGIIFVIFLLVSLLSLVPFQSLPRTPCEIKTPVVLTCDSVWYVRQTKHYQDNTPVLGDEVQWIIEIPLTYIQNLDDERCVQEGRFVNDGRFSWECDTAPGDLPMFYLGKNTCYGREIFIGNYAIRKQTVICYVPKECSINEVKDMVVREIELNFGEESDNVKVFVGECHLTFDDAERHNGLRQDFKNTVTSQQLHEILERNDYGKDAGL